MTLDLDALAAKTASRPASCLECGMIVRAAEYGGRTEIMPVEGWWLDHLPWEVAWDWSAAQGFGWYSSGSVLNHVCRPYAVGEPMTEEACISSDR